MEVYKSNYLLVDFFPEQELMESTWLATTNKMTDDEFKHEILKNREVIVKVRPTKMRIDLRDFFFVMSPEIQEWTDQTIYRACFEVGLRNLAFISPQQIIAQIAVEQSIEESEGQKFNTRYFTNKEEAKKWLLAL